MSEHPYTKLKAEYEHLLGRTWDLFKQGRRAEDALRMAVANAYHFCDRLEKCDDIEQIKSNARKVKQLMADCDKKYCDLTGEKEDSKYGSHENKI